MKLSIKKINAFISDKSYLIILLSFFLLFGYVATGRNDIIQPMLGVWANTNSELVQTEKYTLNVERKNGISVMLSQNNKNTLVEKSEISQPYIMAETNVYMSIAHCLRQIPSRWKIFIFFCVLFLVSKES